MLSPEFEIRKYPAMNRHGPVRLKRAGILFRDANRYQR